MLLASVSASAHGLTWRDLARSMSLPDVSFLTWEFPPLCLGFQQSMRENKEKQALSDLMIKPVQRIPRYELLVKVGMGLVGQGGVEGEQVCSQTPGRKEGPP